MLIRLALASIVGAVVMYLWGWAYWTVAPQRFAVMKPLPNEGEVVELLKKDLSEEGVYFSPFPEEPSPGMTKEEQDAAMQACFDRHLAGPLIKVSFKPGGVDWMMVMAQGFGHMLASALLAGILMIAALPGLKTYLCRVGFVLLLGVFASFVTYISEAIWFHAPLNYQLLLTAFTVSEWLLAGVVMSLIIRPKAVA